MNILVAKNGSQLGPFSETDLRAKLASGEFSPTDLGWREGMPAWSPLSEVLGSASAQPAAPAAPAPQPYAPQPYAAPQGQNAPQPYNSPYPSPYPQGGVQQWGAQGSSGYAGFWLRFVAAFVDGIILNIIMFIVGFIIGLVLGATHMANQNSLVVFVNLLSFIVYFLYFALMESSASQATLGKQALGIKVTDLNGGRISFGQAVGRWFGKFVSAFILLIGFIMAGFTERKQALHDIMASTLVVRK